MIMTQQNQGAADHADDTCKITNGNIWKIFNDSLQHNDTSQVKECSNWLKTMSIMTLSQYCQVLINLSTLQLNNSGSNDFNFDNLMKHVVYHNDIKSIFEQQEPKIEEFYSLIHSPEIANHFNTICMLSDKSIFGKLITRLLQESMENFEQKDFVKLFQLYYNIFDSYSKLHKDLVYGNNLELNAFNVLYILNDKFARDDPNVNIDMEKEKEFINDVDSSSEWYYMFFMRNNFKFIVHNEFEFLTILFDAPDEILDTLFTSQTLRPFLEKYSFDNQYHLKNPNCTISNLLENKKLRHYFPSWQTVKIGKKDDIHMVKEYECRIRKNGILSSDTTAVPLPLLVEQKNDSNETCEAYETFVVRQISKSWDRYDLIENEMRIWQFIDEYNNNDNNNNARKYDMNRYCIDRYAYDSGTSNRFGQGNQTTCMKIFGIYETRTHIYYITPYIERSLLHYLMKNTITDFESCNILRQCCLAVQDMHNIGLAHRGLSLTSFLIDTNLNILLDNFSLSGRYNSNDSDSKDSGDDNIFDKVLCFGDSDFVAPELLINQAGINNYDWRKNDTFGMGVIALLLLFRSCHKGLKFKSCKKRRKKHAEICFKTGFYGLVHMDERLECGEFNKSNLDEEDQISMRALDVMLDNLPYFDEHFVDIVKMALDHNPNGRITIQDFQKEIEGLMNKLICNSSNPHSMSLSQAYHVGGEDDQKLKNVEGIKRWCNGVKTMIQTMNFSYNCEIDDDNDDKIEHLISRRAKFFSNDRLSIIECTINEYIDNDYILSSNDAFSQLKPPQDMVPMIFAIKHCQNKHISILFDDKWDKFLKSRLCFENKFQIFDGTNMKQEFLGDNVDHDCDVITLFKNEYLQRLDIECGLYPESLMQDNV